MRRRLKPIRDGWRFEACEGPREELSMTPSLSAGPVSSASPDGLGAFWYVIVGALACFIVWTLVRNWKRAKEIRQYAKSKGYAYLGASLPRSFPFRNTSMSWATSVANAVAGDHRSKELLFFDCKLGSGKGRRTQTVIAIRGPEEWVRPA